MGRRAAGVMNFLRTMSGAVATAIGTTMWYDGAQNLRAQLSGVLNGAAATMPTNVEFWRVKILCGKAVSPIGNL